MQKGLFLHTQMLSSNQMYKCTYTARSTASGVESTDLNAGVDGWGTGVKVDGGLHHVALATGSIQSWDLELQELLRSGGVSLKTKGRGLQHIF